MSNNSYTENRREVKRLVATLFSTCLNEYGRALVAENMVDASSEQSIEAAIDYWGERLMSVRITCSQIEKGIERVKTDPRFSQYPPKLRQFVDLCKPGPDALKLPDFDQAFLIATGAESVDSIPPAIAYAIQKVGHWDITHSDENSTPNVRKRFQRYYQEAIDLLLKNQFTLPQPQGVQQFTLPSGRAINAHDPVERQHAISSIDQLLDRLKT